MASIYQSHKPAAGEGGGLYLRLNDGETVRLRLASEPVIYESEYKDTLSTKYAWIVYNQDAKQAQVFQQSARFFKQVAALANDDEWGDPTEYDIKVTRQGIETDTTYTVMPSANREALDSEAREAIAKLDLIKLIEVGRGNQRVMWLSDYDKQTTGAKTTAEPAAKPIVKPAPKKDTVIEDIGDEPINLDDIPF
jgi:hypothetical protein